MPKYNVALHPEGVDRNPNLYDIPLDPEVALHPEGVDRNKLKGVLIGSP